MGRGTEIKRRRLPRYCSEYKDRHGKWRVRYRRNGKTLYYFKATAWTPEFQAEYQVCLEGRFDVPKEVASSRTTPGSLDALVVAYYQSPEFHNLSDTTKNVYRRILERFRKAYGTNKVSKIEARHIRAIIGKQSGVPTAANRMLSLLRILMRLAVELDMRKDDPTIGVRKFRVKSDGFHTWTEAEIQKFQSIHPIGSKARLAFALFLYTGQRRSDVVQMGWQHVKGGMIAVTQQKTGTKVMIPIAAELMRVLQGASRDQMNFLVTQAGKPHSAKAFGNLFRKWCDEAGLEHCSAHGLRKACATRLAEAGCTDKEIMAITGHQTLQEVGRYTKAASQEHMALGAMEKLQQLDDLRANQSVRLANFGEKPNKNKEA